MSKSVILFADGCEECEGLIVVDFLRRAGLDIKTVSIKDVPKVTSSHNITFETDDILDNVSFDDIDMIILPGGIPGTPNLAADERICKLCVDFAANKKIAAICAAPGILAKLGLLSGRRATINPSLTADLIDAIVTNERVTVDGNIITGTSVGAAMEFAIEIIRLLEGDDLAESIASKTHMY